MWIEIFGIISSIIILVSICFDPQSKKGNIVLRTLNTIGSVAFVIYGLLIPAYATVFMNICAAIINLIYLVKSIRSAN